jgi:hypothetical protein
MLADQQWLISVIRTETKETIMSENMSETRASSEDDIEKPAAADAALAVKRWRYGLLASPIDARDRANAAPAQVAGEAVFSVRDNGQVDTFLFF